MPQLPTGQLTRKGIVDRALRKAGNSALSAGPTYEAQIWLNNILFDLYTTYTWPFLRTSTPVDLSTGTITLPADFLQTYNDTALIVTAVGGTPTFKRLQEVDQELFLQLDRTGTVRGTPSAWTIDRTQGVAYCTPAPDAVAYTGILYYQRLPTLIPIDGTGDSLIPTFPWSDFLIQALYVAALEYESDGRSDTEAVKREQLLSRIVNRANPLRSQSPVIPLDPQVFSSTFNGD